MFCKKLMPRNHGIVLVDVMMKRHGPHGADLPLGAAPERRNRTMCGPKTGVVSSQTSLVTFYGTRKVSMSRIWGISFLHHPTDISWQKIGAIFYTHCAFSNMGFLQWFLILQKGSGLVASNCLKLHTLTIHGLILQLNQLLSQLCHPTSSVLGKQVVVGIRFRHVRPDGEAVRSSPAHLEIRKIFRNAALRIFRNFVGFLAMRRTASRDNFN